METDREQMRDLLATLLHVGDYQELMGLYQSTDLVVPVERLAELYETAPEDRKAVDEIREAITDELLPAPDQRVTVPTEMVELVARTALESGRDVMAIRALREAGKLDEAYSRYVEYGLESLREGQDERAAFELRLAGRLSWSRLAPEMRLEAVVSLGVDPAELAHSLGGESARGKVSGGRPLPDFPAWQAYGPLLHARCRDETCVAGLPLERAAGMSVRYLLHDNALAEKALEAVDGDALRLVRTLASESDPELGEYAECYQAAEARYKAVEELTGSGDVRGEGKPEEGEEKPEEGDQPPKDDRTEREEKIRSGLEEVQGLLLGHAESEWRGCLSQLAAQHPLSVFTVCTVRASDIGTYAVPVGATGRAYLEAVVG